MVICVPLSRNGNPLLLRDQQIKDCFHFQFDGTPSSQEIQILLGFDQYWYHGPTVAINKWFSSERKICSTVGHKNLYVSTSLQDYSPGNSTKKSSYPLRNFNEWTALYNIPTIIEAIMIFFITFVFAILSSSSASFDCRPPGPIFPWPTNFAMNELFFSVAANLSKTPGKSYFWRDWRWLAGREHVFLSGTHQSKSAQQKTFYHLA